MAKKKSNLKPVRSKNEARERGKKGGVASGEARRKKREFKENLKVGIEILTEIEGKKLKQKESKELMKEVGYLGYQLLNLLGARKDSDRINVIKEINTVLGNREPEKILAKKEYIVLNDKNRKKAREQMDKVIGNKNLKKK